MSTGLIALLDDVAALAKLAAASLDDVAAHAAKAGSKAAGIVIDDAAVTPRYVVGFASDRELPIIRRIAVSSLRNKLIYLLPGCLLLSYYAPALLTPLLMIGGAFLCVEGYHKAAAAFQTPALERVESLAGANFAELERQRVASAVRTDFILSAEIMAISLAGVAGQTIWMQAAVLTAVGIGMTVLVYGVVALIVKADDAGVALAASNSASARYLGRALVTGMPGFLKALSFIGMLAMLWVGGGIVLHGLHEVAHVGWEHALQQWAYHVAAAVPVGGAAVAWLIHAAVAGLFGLALGAAVALPTDRLLHR